MAKALTPDQIQEKKWEAEHDADTLLSANAITKDAKRFDAAMKNLDDRQKSIANLRRTHEATVKKGE